MVGYCLGSKPEIVHNRGVLNQPWPTFEFNITLTSGKYMLVQLLEEHDINVFIPIFWYPGVIIVADKV